MVKEIPKDDNDDDFNDDEKVLRKDEDKFKLAWFTIRDSFKISQNQ